MRHITILDYAKAAKNGIGQRQLYIRIRNGWDMELATTKQVRPHVLRPEWVALAEANGIPAKTFHDRIRDGWTPVRAATKPRKKVKPNAIQAT